MKYLCFSIFLQLIFVFTSESGSSFSTVSCVMIAQPGRLKNITEKRDVVGEDLGENPPGLQPPIQRLMTCPRIAF
jgi:hypothetical protein